jgi:plastocyanin
MLKKLFALLVLGSLSGLLLTACSASAGPNPVHMDSKSFVQSSITIQSGQSLTLINDSLVSRHVIANGTWEGDTAKPAAEPGAPQVANVNIGIKGSAPIGPFTTAGTFHLFCPIHPGMNLTVIVQ